MIIQFYGFHKLKFIIIPVACFLIFSILWFFLLLHWYARKFELITFTLVVIDLSIVKLFKSIFFSNVGVVIIVKFY